MGPVGEGVTAITPTGDRPLAFALCQQWMKNQTLKPSQWIIVDDGKTPLIPTSAMQYVRREPRTDEPKPTLHLNLKTVLPLIKGNKIMIIEDDEYYAPDYIAEMSRQLDQHEIVGIMRAKYYHLPTGGYVQIWNTGHASLAETGFRNSFLPEFRELLNGDVNVFVDGLIWPKAGKRGYLFVDDDKPLYLGIKGLPGRNGIGMGHNPSMYRMQDTNKREMLKRWVPKDYQVYMDILSGKLTGENYHSYFPSDLPITGITVCWNTKDLIERAYNSMRKFYPDMPIVIIDGSDAGDPCATYVRGLASPITTVVQPGYNIGHGRGMCAGIEKVKTSYALIFDSDIELLEPCVPAMLAMMEEDTFGVGYIEKTGYDGFVYGVHAHHENETPVRNLHPYFQLINIGNYKKFHPYVHHGMPTYLTMLDIHKRGLSEKIVKQFPGLMNHIANKFVRHDSGMATGDRRKAKGLPHIEGTWVFNKGLV
jgi:glycosyltransferase involved in cell wall biosynthesis